MRKFAVAFSLLAITLAPLSGQAAPDKTFGSDSIACGDNGTISWTPTTLWPPNHKLHTITATYTDPDGGTSTLTLTQTDHSDMVGGEEEEGSGNTDPGTDSFGGTPATGEDGAPAVVDDANARAERSGKNKAGRTYSFEYVATNDGGTPADTSDDDGCMGPDDQAATDDEILVTVPHDCRNGGCNQGNK